MNFARYLELARRDFPQRPALLFESSAYDYAAVDCSSSQIALQLLALGVSPDDRVAICIPNRPEWVFAYFGILKLGAIAVSMSPMLKVPELRALVEDAQPAVILASPGAQSAVQAAAAGIPVHLLSPRAGPADAQIACFAAAARGFHDPAAIVYTSGTTGSPKGVVLSHGNIEFNCAAKQRYMQVLPEDRLLLFLPLHHCFGQNAVLNAAVLSGATVVLHQRFDAAQVVTSAVQDSVTMFFGIPASYSVLLECARPRDFASVRYFFSAAAPLPVVVERRWMDRFSRVIHQGYGLTETSPFASYNHATAHREGSIGSPIDGVEMKVVSVDDGQPVPAGTSGEIVIRGPNVMLGYWRRPEETAQAVRDGWFHTGDIGKMDAGGYFYLEDRLKDMINVGGLKVYPAEVENVIASHPAVFECAVYGAREEIVGERVLASIVLQPAGTVSASEILGICRNRLASYKVPAAVEFRPELPRNRSGKILKRILRQEAEQTMREDAIGAQRLHDRAFWQAWIIEWLAAALNQPVDTLHPGFAFFDLGVTSVIAVELAREASRQAGIRLDPTALWNYPTPEKLAGAVAASQGSPAPAANR